MIRRKHSKGLTLEFSMEGEPSITITGPKCADVITALCKIKGTDNSYAILFKNEMTYIQTDGCNALEHRKGDLDYLHTCPTEYSSFEKIEKAFLSYFNDDNRWKVEVPWDIVSDEHKRLISTKQVCKMFGVNERKLKNLRQDPTFPKPMRFGIRNMWEIDKIETWLRNNYYP